MVSSVLKPAAEPPIRNLVDETKDAWVPLGTLLLRVGAIDPEQLEIALTEKERSPRRLGEILVEWGWVSSEALARALADQFGMEFYDLAANGYDEDCARLLSAEVAERLQALPIRLLLRELLFVGIADPTDLAAAEELRARLGTAIRIAVVDGRVLAEALVELRGHSH